MTRQRAFKKKLLKTIFHVFFFNVKDKFIKKGWAPCNVFFSKKTVPYSPGIHHSNPACSNTEQHKHLEPGNPCRSIKCDHKIIKRKISFIYSETTLFVKSNM